MPSADFGSMPALSKWAMRAARTKDKVPENLSDEEVLAQGIITPEMLELLMIIAAQLIQGCLDNNASLAWRTIQRYVSSKPMDRLGDNLRLNGLVGKWLDNLASARERGDVVMLREAMSVAAGSMTEAEFRALQTEVLWLTI